MPGDETSSDEELAPRFLSGDENAARILIKRYQRPLFGLLYRLTGNAADAEELFQEALYRALRAGATYDARRRFKPWLYAIAVNLARDRAQRSSHRATPELRAAEDLPDGDPREHETEWIARADVVRALAELPPSHRDVVVLRYFEGLEEAEIAEAAGIPRGTVKSRLHHALRKMKDSLSAAERSPS
jgi:RNA polymerase sigma-70 factor, ECF subfamily